MKNYIIGFLVGVLLIGLTSSKTVVQPVPKEVFVQRFIVPTTDELQCVINRYQSKGFVIKSINGAGAHSIWVLVMERY